MKLHMLFTLLFISSMETDLTAMRQLARLAKTCRVRTSGILGSQQFTGTPTRLQSSTYLKSQHILHAKKLSIKPRSNVPGGRSLVDPIRIRWAHADYRLAYSLAKVEEEYYKTESKKFILPVPYQMATTAAMGVWGALIGTDIGSHFSSPVSGAILGFGLLGSKAMKEMRDVLRHKVDEQLLKLSHGEVNDKTQLFTIHERTGDNNEVTQSIVPQEHMLRYLRVRSLEAQKTINDLMKNELLEHEIAYAGRLFKTHESLLKLIETIESAATNKNN